MTGLLMVVPQSHLLTSCGQLCEGGVTISNLVYDIKPMAVLAAHRVAQHYIS